MEEEVTQKTIALVIRSAKLDAGVLKAAMRMYLNQHRQQAARKMQNTHGKISVKELIGKDAGVASIEVTDKNIRSFEKIARKYNVDFALKKDRTVDPPKYLVFFKGRDTDAIAQAFKEYVHDNEKKKNRPSIREKIKCVKNILSQDKNRERTRDKNKDRGRSL